MNTNEKLREALLTARSAINDFSHSGLIDTDTYKAEIAQIDEALALPRRNCDVGTAYEQHMRFRHFCQSHYGCYSTAPDLVFEWAQMPYEEVK